MRRLYHGRGGFRIRIQTTKAFTVAAVAVTATAALLSFDFGDAGHEVLNGVADDKAGDYRRVKRAHSVAPADGLRLRR